MDDPDVDVVYIAAPNMVHVELVEAAAEAGKHVFCEKPVGGTPEQTVRAERAARRAGVNSGVGYNYRWAPLVRHTRALIEAGELGELTNYRGRFFSMYGSDPLGLLSWRFKLDEGGYGVTSDLLSHSVDLAQMLVGPDHARRRHDRDVHRASARSLVPGAGHYGRGAPGDPTGEVTNEDYAGMLCEFANGVRGTFEASRTIVGPESQMAFDVYGTRGAAGWNLEKLNELRHYRLTDDPSSGYTTVFGGDRFPYHGNFVPGSANGIGFEDLVVIEDYEFCRSIAEERPFSPGFAEAVEWVSVQAALLKSVQSGSWEAGRVPEGRVMAATTTKAVRVGVIGAGRIGRMHAELLARQVPGARLTAVQDADEDTARGVAGQLGAAHAVTVEDVFGDADAVAICYADAHPRRSDRRRPRARARRSSARSRYRSIWPRSIARWRRWPRPACRSRSASTAASIPATRRSPPRSRTARSATRSSRASPAATPRRRPAATSRPPAASSST